MLRLQQFSKSYGGRQVLAIEHVSFEKGIYWVKGENGSGKSTLFKAVAGIIPFDGDIFCDNLNLKKHGVAYRRVVNYAEAEPLYPGFLTAKDLIRFVGDAKGSTRAQQNYYVEKFGVTSYFETPVDTFSSGMLKKLSLVMAFLGTPKVILLDEPLITLDVDAAKVLAETIQEATSRGIMFIISSHQDLSQNNLDLTAVYRIENQTLRFERAGKHIQ
ncbi:ABC transporter ATP-binding protein [Chryseosolibacter indicus]|uniref:ABC transporter ATP-binding protein n=1 Tax=Chryseosolibacter indicus TaxID=2782351 RepID=A0ABS5VU48_9BACT|nr:ABC transporter ATP-binding protein [Chryseosolibacter indicus]MBT1704952.1 ABC transporter ATP-binding protein [Chryseosolibacter indicus]